MQSLVQLKTGPGGTSFKCQNDIIVKNLTKSFQVAFKDESNRNYIPCDVGMRYGAILWDF